MAWHALQYEAFLVFARSLNRECAAPQIEQVCSTVDIIHDLVSWNQGVVAMSFLKPCPFCGAGESNVEPAGRVWREGAWRHEHWTVMHDCAEAESWPAQTLIIRGTTREQAIARWNQRSQENAR
jgi:hypothetical protein